jgi:hypothetical protein
MCIQRYLWYYKARCRAAGHMVGDFTACQVRLVRWRKQYAMCQQHCDQPPCVNVSNSV